ncbi:ABC transporter substrate-binding protein [Lutimaribacter sp. EGI FJ00015]|uniref:ABC transporter substrate-binding protein n=1 Tax=Lutimaribacter degradans TaxID=2945989 RepID=A0ACC5ZY65_9RHOB|nr:ABC transporter substrate-binding protein [Lutimaribacter sp. EGI FJ00013]MCM2563287.1 ABC transporter substrate-binding protein [Lutimaribacter sp. EGI FJ00013]MCO0614390.1 ABC transporter substrate-binding protein [Lutimaribacter sp. EGI FJ00015]MCO0636009.1 ABC transporter substrate-binding protein [Lutimaribacter sp. EGI FJ00014]
MKDQIDYLKVRAALGKITRREFMGRMGALGVSAALANTMLADAVHAAGPQKGGTMRVGIQGGASSDSLDPALAANSVSTQVNRLWGEPLVELAPESGVEGKVAESFSSSPDARIWTFKIRQGITFSNGKTVTADDVVATIERHSGEETKSGALGLLRNIQNVSADGDSVVIELDGPNADLPYYMADYHLMIQPNGGKDDPTAAIGTGPYILKEVDMGVRFIAEKNPNYWGDLGHADTIEVLVINDNTARVAALQSGQVDMIDRVPPRTAGLIERAPNITVRTTSGPGHYVFIMHCDTAPFDNNDLRLALKYGMNRQEMVDKILFGYGSVGNDTPINASYPLYSEIEQREYDPDKAKFHLDKSGFDGTVLLRTSDNSFPGAPDASALFQQSCAAAGINVEIKREPNDGYWSEVWNKQPFCTSYWSGRPTQDQMYATAYLSTADWNDTRFNNEKFDQLLVAARAELDEAKRTQMYADMGTIVHNEGGLICPMFNDFVEATSDRIAGWVPGQKGFGLMNFYAAMKMWVAA